MFIELKEKISPEMNKKDIEKILFTNNEYKMEIATKINLIKEGLEKDKVFKDIQNECNNEILSDIIIAIIKDNITPFEETQFLREENFEKFKYLINYLFENMILQIELKKVIKEATNLEDDQINCAGKLLYTAMEWAINKRYSNLHFYESFYDMFRFEKNKIDFIWELYTQNKQTLINIVLLNNINTCKEIKQKVEHWSDLFMKIFDEDEENENDD